MLNTLLILVVVAGVGYAIYSYWGQTDPSKGVVARIGAALALAASAAVALAQGLLGGAGG